MIYLTYFSSFQNNGLLFVECDKYLGQLIFLLILFKNPFVVLFLNTSKHIICNNLFQMHCLRFFSKLHHLRIRMPQHIFVLSNNAIKSVMYGNKKVHLLYLFYDCSCFFQNLQMLGKISEKNTKILNVKKKRLFFFL